MSGVPLNCHPIVNELSNEHKLQSFPSSLSLFKLHLKSVSFSDEQNIHIYNIHPPARKKNHSLLAYHSQGKRMVGVRYC